MKFNTIRKVSETECNTVFAADLVLDAPDVRALIKMENTPYLCHRIRGLMVEQIVSRMRWFNLLGEDEKIGYFQIHAQAVVQLMQDLLIKHPATILPKNYTPSPVVCDDDGVFEDDSELGRETFTYFKARSHSTISGIARSFALAELLTLVESTGVLIPNLSFDTSDPRVSEFLCAMVGAE